MTKKQRSELRSRVDRIANCAGLALNLAWDAAKGTTEGEAVDTIGELMMSAKTDIHDLQQLLDEIREQDEAKTEARQLEGKG